MKLVDRHNAAMLAFLALGARVVFALTVDGPELLNSAWVSALAACAFTVPLALSMDFIEQSRQESSAHIMQSAWGRVYCAVLCLFLLYEAGSCISLFSGSAAYLSLETSMTPLLTVFCALVGALACMAGTQAVTGAANIGVRVFILAMLAVVFSQLNSYNIRWLTPVLGPGVPELAKSTVNLGGMMTGLIPIWLITQPEKRPGKRLYMLKVLVLVTIFATVMPLLYGMLTPPMPSGSTTRWFQLERLLDNGRVHQALPVIMVPMWYGLMITYVAFSLLAGSQTLMLALPVLKPKWAILIFTVAALAVAFADVSSRPLIGLVNAVRWPVCTLPIFIYALVRAIKQKKEASA